MGRQRGQFFNEVDRAASIEARRTLKHARAARLAPVVEGMRAAGVTSLVDIAAALTDAGIPTPRGSVVWSSTMVKRLTKAIDG